MAAPVGAAPVESDHEDDPEQQAGDRGEGSDSQRRHQVERQIAGDRGGLIRLSRLVGPGDQANHGQRDRNREETPTGSRRSGGTRTTESVGVQADLRAALGETSAAAQQPLGRDEEHCDTDQQHRQLRCRVAVARPEPDAQHAVGDRRHVEQPDGADIGQDLHADQRRATGDRWASHREHDTPERLHPTASEAARHVDHPLRLLTEGRTSEEVHVRIERQRQHERTQPDGTHLTRAERFLQGAEPHETEHVPRDGKGHDEQPTEQSASGKLVGGHEPGERRPEHHGAREHCEQQRCRVADHPAEPGRPELAPHLGARLHHRPDDHQHRERNGQGDREHHDRARQRSGMLPRGRGVDHRLTRSRWR